MFTAKYILHKYLFKEMLPVFGTGIFVLGFIVMGSRLLGITELVVNLGVSVTEVFKLVLFLLPRILLLSLPAAALMASLLAFIRLSSDNEIIALKCSGISLYQILPPVLVLGLGAFILAGLTSFLGVPWGNRAVKDAVYSMARSGADVGLKERVFSEPFDDVMFYVHDLSTGDQAMRDVFVVDQREEDMISIIVAAEAGIMLQPEVRDIVVRFKDGMIFMDQRRMESVKTVEFKTYDLKVSLEEMMQPMGDAAKAPKEMGVGELLERLEGLSEGDSERDELQVELLERITLPVGIFLLMIVGMPLGTHMRSRAFSTGIGVSLGVFLAYYMIFVGTRNLCETGQLDPRMGMWIPNLFLLASCIHLFRLAAAEKPLPFSAEAPLRRRLAARRTRASSLTPDARGGPAAGTGAGREPYVGNIREAKFHRSGCRCVRGLAPDNRLFFPSRESAVESGYKPCKVCRP
ncbi:MAG: LptF/LptG family permease [Desulfobacteraceae bacterium]